MKFLRRHLRIPQLKFTRLLLVISLISLMSVGLWSQDATQPLTPAQQDIATKYSIDPQKQYAGSLVVKALDVVLTAAEDEAKVEATSAWNEGYKQGVLDWKPKADGFQAQSNYWEGLEIKSEKKASVFLVGGISTTIIAFLVGVLAIKH